MRSLLRIGGLSLVLVTPLACGDDGTSEGKTTPPPPATRSPACTEFQDAACARAERCGRSGPECYTALRSTFCTSDDDALSCAEQIENASCTATVPCGETVFDPKPAIAVCNDYVDAACEMAIRCDPSITTDACHTEISAVVDCSKALGILGDPQVCFDDLASAPCEGEFKLPPSCSGMIQTQ